MNTLKIAHKK
jgi:hypothetical protein